MVYRHPLSFVEYPLEDPGNIVVYFFFWGFVVYVFLEGVPNTPYLQVQVCSENPRVYQSRIF